MVAFANPMIFMPAKRPPLPAERPLRLVSSVRARRRPAAGHRRAHRRGQGRRARPGAAGRHRLGQDLHRRQGDRGGAAAGPGPRPEQDAGRTALRRDEGVLPGERGRVLRLLLRLLPAGGVRPAHRHLHREGQLHQRADRPDAPRRDPGAARAQRRDPGGLGLLHLRHRRGGELLADDPDARRRAARRAARDHPPPGRAAVQAQRRQLRPRLVPGARRRAGDLPLPPGGPGLAAVDVRRRDRGGVRDRPAHRREGGGAGRHHRLPQQPLRDAAADAAAGDAAGSRPS